MSKKTVPGILRFISILFLIFEKGMSKKTVPGILRFVSIPFLIFEKWMSKKTVPDILRFESILFLVLLFLKNYYYKRDCISIFRFVSMVIF